MEERVKFSKSVRKDVYAKCQGCCAYCGEKISIDDMQVDHVVPLHCGGTNEIGNLLPSCRACNHYKATLDLEKFREMILGIPKRLRESGSAAYKMALRTGLIKEDKDARKDFKFYFERLNELLK